MWKTVGDGAQLRARKGLGAMGRPEEPLDRDGSPVREFAFWLRDLRRQSGLTYEQLGRNAHYATSTVQAAAAGRRLPTLRVTTAIVRACGGNQRQWREYWARIRRVLDADAPGGIAASVTPPWAEGVPAPAGAPAPAQPDHGRPAADSRRAGGLDGWFIESFAALLRLDVDPVEVIERRTVVATRDGIDKLVASVSVPRVSANVNDAHGLESELMYGGLLHERKEPYDSYFEHVIELPRPLADGERHEFAMRLRVPQGQRMTPHFLHVPFRRSERFDLRVRFDPGQLPAVVWLLRDAPPGAVYQGEPAGVPLVPDRCGEVRLSFTALRPGLGYGVRWCEPDRKLPRM